MSGDALSSNLEPLVLDLVEWVAREPRTYREVMDAWRTSCPRLTVWEEAVKRGLLARVPSAMVEATPAGLALLAATRGSGSVSRSEAVT